MIDFRRPKPYFFRGACGAALLYCMSNSALTPALLIQSNVLLRSKNTHGICEKYFLFCVNPAAPQNQKTSMVCAKTMSYFESTPHPPESEKPLGICEKYLSFAVRPAPPRIRKHERNPIHIFRFLILGGVGVRASSWFCPNHGGICKI